MDKEELEKAYQEIIAKEQLDDSDWKQRWNHAHKVLKVSRAGLILAPLHNHWWDVFPLGHHYCPNDGSRLVSTRYAGIIHRCCKLCNYEWATWR